MLSCNIYSKRTFMRGFSLPDLLNQPSMPSASSIIPRPAKCHSCFSTIPGTNSSTKGSTTPPTKRSIIINGIKAMPKQLNFNHIIDDGSTTIKLKKHDSERLSSPQCSRNSSTLIDGNSKLHFPSTTTELSASTRKRLFLAGMLMLPTSLLFEYAARAEEVPNNYRSYTDLVDGYKYYFPADWRDFDFMGHDSAFKDNILPLHNVRVCFRPTSKSDINELGPMEEVIPDLVTNVYAAPDQDVKILNMQERSLDGRNYWTFEYDIASTGYSRTSFATLGIGNGKYYTLIVGANGRRWKKLRDKLMVVADSFRIFDV